MAHINTHGGRFVTVLPRTRTADRTFRAHLATTTPVWTEATRRPGPHLTDPHDVYSTTPAPLPSAEGYRIVWVHSTAKAARDGATRRDRIEAGVAAIEALAARLAGPRSRFKTRTAVEQAATAALTDTRSARWVTYSVEETTVKTYKQARAGRPGPATDYREICTTRFTVHPDIALDTLAADAAGDGCFPLITNDHDLTDAQVLAGYPPPTPNPRTTPDLTQRVHRPAPIHQIPPPRSAERQTQTPAHPRRITPTGGTPPARD